MRDIMKDPKSAADAYVAFVPAHKGKEDYVRRVFELYNKNVYVNQKVIGQMDETRLNELQKFYVSNGIVSKELPPKDFYTNQFVGK